MFKKLSLQGRLFGSFILMGLLVLVVAIVGWSGSSRLSAHIDTLANNTLPSVTGLWKINEGQTQIQSSERSFLNPLLSLEKRQVDLERIKNAWQQIDEGFKQYETSPQTEEEKKIYKKFLQDWDRWKRDHEQFMQIYQQFARLNVLDPAARLSEIVNQKPQNLTQLAIIKQADALLDKLSDLAANEERASFTAATESVVTVAKYNEMFGASANNAAEKDVTQTSFWVVVGMIIGPLTAIIFGIFFSITIAKPLGAKISKIVNSIVTSSSEIAATVEQQERTATQQAASVNQTSSTMDELEASSRLAAEQAEAATAGARAIAEQIFRLSEQIKQIGSISGVVSELANQTNMLALNAAVEAARAGQNGKGFAVVAGEIRKLADQSKKSAERINDLVGDIQAIANSTVMDMGQGTKVESIVTAVNNIVMNNQQISLSASQQAIAVQQVVQAMNTLNIAAQETASGISQTKVATQKLNEAALALQTVV